MNYTLEELIEQYTLSSNELQLIFKKSGSARLGFAILLKFFENEGAFPENKETIADGIVQYISKQLKVDPSEFTKYDWSKRNLTYHRKQIRDYFGFREVNINDLENLKKWLRKNIFHLILKHKQSKINQ